MFQAPWDAEEVSHQYDVIRSVSWGTSVNEITIRPSKRTNTEGHEDGVYDGQGVHQAC